jgi:hypothetical protein
LIARVDELLVFEVDRLPRGEPGTPEHPDALVPVVDGLEVRPLRRPRVTGMPFDGRVIRGEDGREVPALMGVHDSPHDFDVLNRHPEASIS